MPEEVGKTHGQYDVIHSFSVLCEMYQGKVLEWEAAASAVKRVISGDSSFEREAPVFGQTMEENSES